VFGDVLDEEGADYKEEIGEESIEDTDLVGVAFFERGKVGKHGKKGLERKEIDYK